MRRKLNCCTEMPLQRGCWTSFMTVLNELGSRPALVSHRPTSTRTSLVDPFPPLAFPQSSHSEPRQTGRIQQDGPAQAACAPEVRAKICSRGRRTRILARFAAGVWAPSYARRWNGKQKGCLRPAEHKSIHTDRIVLVPGPPNENPNDGGHWAWWNHSFDWMDRHSPFCFS